MTKFYHGSKVGGLTEIAANQCITPSQTYAAEYARGKVGSSQSSKQTDAPGWVYVLELTPAQVKEEDGDYKLTEAVAHVDVIPAQDIPPGTIAQSLH